MYETQKAGENTSPEMKNWVKAIERTYADEEYFNTILRKPSSEHKRMLLVLKELAA